MVEGRTARTTDTFIDAEGRPYIASEHVPVHVYERHNLVLGKLASVRVIAGEMARNPDEKIATIGRSLLALCANGTLRPGGENSTP